MYSFIARSLVQMLIIKYGVMPSPSFASPAMPPNTYSNVPVEANPCPCLAVMPSMVRLVQLTTVSLVGSSEYRSSWFPVRDGGGN